MTCRCKNIWLCMSFASDNDDICLGKMSPRLHMQDVKQSPMSQVAAGLGGGLGGMRNAVG